MGAVAGAVAIGAAIGGGIGGISSAVTGGDIGMGILGGAVGGGLTGGLMGPIGSALGTGVIGSGAIAGSIGGVANSLIVGGDPLMGAVTGAAGGAINGWMQGSGLWGSNSNPIAEDLGSMTPADMIPEGDMTSMLNNGSLQEVANIGGSDVIYQNTTNGLYYNANGALVDPVTGGLIVTDGAGNLFNGSTGQLVTAEGATIGSADASGASGLFGAAKAALGFGPSSGSGASSGGNGLGGWGTAALLGGGALITGIMGANAAQQAAELQANAAAIAADNQMKQYYQTRADLLPYNAVGLNAANALTSAMGLQQGQDPSKSLLLSRFEPTNAQLAQTPGYKFTLDQGLTAAQNNMTAQGLGRSGAAAKGAINYAEGLAGTTYQQQYANEMAYRNSVYNYLAGNLQAGQNAATATGNFGMNATASANNYLTAGANAQAAGTIGTANAYGGAINGVSNALIMNSMLNNMYGGR